MKILLVVAFLALASFAYGQKSFKGAATQVIQNNKGKPDFGDVAKQVIMLNDKQKKQFSEAVINDMKTSEKKKCMDDLSPVLLDTSVKYLKKVVNGEAFYEKEGKEFEFTRFVKHSKVFKTATTDKCLKSFVKSLGKAAKAGVTFIFVAALPAFG